MPYAVYYFSQFFFKPYAHWNRVVVQTGAYADALELVGTTTRCQLSSIKLVQCQKYRLLLQPVPMTIGTCCNSN